MALSSSALLWSILFEFLFLLMYTVVFRVRKVWGAQGAPLVLLVIGIMIALTTMIMIPDWNAIAISVGAAFGFVIFFALYMVWQKPLA